jgi:hypothetical protein
MLLHGSQRQVSDIITGSYTLTSSGAHLRICPRVNKQSTVMQFTQLIFVMFKTFTVTCSTLQHMFYKCVLCYCNFSYFTGTTEWLALLPYIREVQGSNIDPDTDYPDWGISWSSSFPSDREYLDHLRAYQKLRDKLVPCDELTAVVILLVDELPVGSMVTLT